LVLVLAVQFQPTTERVIFRVGFKTGEDFIKATAAERQHYTTGLIDGFMAAPVLSKDATKNAQAIINCTFEKTDAQVAEVIRRHIDGNPSKWNVPANLLALEALVKACNSN
jgi:hypothetical protein